MNLTSTHIPIGSLKITQEAPTRSITKFTENNTVYCEGVDENSKHPKIALSLTNGSVKCPYCYTIFTKKTTK